MRVRIPGLVLAALLAPSPWAAAQERTWRELTPLEGPSPSARRNGAAVYDEVGGRIVIFGGRNDSGDLGDVWAFDLPTRSWMQLAITGAAPEPRFGHDAVYDTQGRRMVIWAGQNASRFLDDTWALDLTTLTWTDLTPDSRPQARYGSASIYDPLRRALVQFAGFTDLSRRFQDTQAFDLDTNEWEELTPAGEKPEIRCLLTAAYDATGHRMVIFGGQRSGPLGDLWAFDLGARSWTDLTPDRDRPSPRYWAASFVDRAGRFHVFGGATSAGDDNDTWAYDFATGQFSRLELTGPPARNGMLSAYVPELDSLFVIGGSVGGRLSNDVWELLPLTPAPSS